MKYLTNVQIVGKNVLSMTYRVIRQNVVFVGLTQKLQAEDKKKVDFNW
jgi:hypothetical protein